MIARAVKSWFPQCLAHRSAGDVGLALLVAGLTCLSGSCSSTPDSLGFTKVKYYHLKEDDRRVESMSIDPMLRFERQHYLHGAVTIEEQRERLGHYYTLFWTGRPEGGPATLRFAYRHARTGERVFVYEHPVTNVKKRNETSFRITGEAYERYGRVVAWEASLLQGGQVLDTTRSFLWR